MFHKDKHDYSKKGTHLGQIKHFQAVMLARILQIAMLLRRPKVVPVFFSEMSAC